MELPLLDVLKCEFAACGRACAAEGSGALPSKHLRSGFPPGEESVMGGRVRATSALRIIYRYSNVLFAHGIVTMLFRTGDWHEKFLAERIFPLDRAYIGIFRDAMRIAAVSAIVLREGFLAIERFRDEDVLRNSQSAWAARSADIDECACKAAFMRYVMWSLNDRVFKRSSTELARACKRDLEAIAGNERAAFLSNLVEHGDALPADERLLVMRTIAVLWSLWISACIIPRAWIPASSNAGGSDDGEESEEDANALYADMEKLLTRDSCMLLTAFRAFCCMDPHPEEKRMPASGGGASSDAQDDPLLLLMMPQARSGIAEPSEQPRSPASDASGSTDVYLDQFAADVGSINAQEEDREGGYATDGIRNNYYEFGTFRSVLPSNVNASKSWDLCSYLLRLQEEEWNPVRPPPPPPSSSSSSASFPCASSMYARIVQTLRGTKPPVRSRAAAEGGTGSAGRPLPHRSDECMTAFDKYSKELILLKPFLSYMAVQFGSVLVNNMYYLKDQHADFMCSVVDRCCIGGCDACRSSSSRIAAASKAHYSEAAHPPSGMCTGASSSMDAVKRHRKV
jgi:hypothetical protein